MKNYILVSAIMLLISFSGKSQEKWWVEFRPGLNFPMNDVGNTDTRTGFGFELTGAYKIMPHLSIYAGWGLNQFKGNDKMTNEDITFKETGFNLGFEIIRRIRTSPFSYLARAGLIYNQLEMENNANDLTLNTGYGFGWQVAAGINYEVAPNLSLRPMFRYRSLRGNVEIANTPTSLNLNYISFGIGSALDF